VRTADLEMLEIRLEPLQTARDRHEKEISSNSRAIKKATMKLKDLQRDASAHTLSIEQGLASIRSLLQRANRAAREQGIITDDDPPPVETPLDNPSPVAQRVRRSGGKVIL